VSTLSTLAVPSPAHATSAAPAHWRWSQHWRDLFFAHWRVAPHELAPFLPAGVEPDVRDGAAWVSAVAFRLESVRPRWFPTFGPASNFLELNLRTYIRCRDEPAIYFLSIHANSRTAIFLARWLTPLPYRFARIYYPCSRPARDFVALPPDGNGLPLFQAEFAPTATAENLSAETPDAWLLERYCAVVPGRRGRLYRMRAWHPPWRAQLVTSQVTARGLGEPWKLDLGRAPDLCHFCDGVDALISPLERVRA
jgi:uncharacterized protein YqjF (DUF2071 family)